MSLAVSPGGDVLVYVVDDQRPFPLAAHAVVHATDGFKWAGESNTAEHAIDWFDNTHVGPTVVLMDVFLGNSDGIEVARTLLQMRPQLQIVLVSTTDEADLPVSAQTCGAIGFLPKSQLSPSTLADLVRPCVS